MTNGPETREDLRDRPLGELVPLLASQIAMLVRQEIELARTELAEKARIAGVGAGLISGAGLVGFAALAALTATFILALVAAGVAAWLAALIVTVVYGVIAGVLALRGREQLKRVAPPVPEQTIDSLKETARWAKTQIK
ncbi:MAG: phage holin family protein [Candidatus Eremiobacteraeota bacterium]|nr:phage holin family protein [Candidatus Eremiobacteraeota bacterium]MBV8366940.1 phage holin family protein [Candidatus Eremiobacteraeota bacterium]